jgi:hypothetical protein
VVAMLKTAVLLPIFLQSKREEKWKEDEGKERDTGRAQSLSRPLRIAFSPLKRTPLYPHALSWLQRRSVAQCSLRFFSPLFPDLFLSFTFWETSNSNEPHYTAGRESK